MYYDYRLWISVCKEETAISHFVYISKNNTMHARVNKKGRPNNICFGNDNIENNVIA